MRNHKSRDELFDLLKYGKLDPEAAEAEASRLGLEPLRSSVDPAQFDPGNEAQWTLPMAVSWIAYRTLHDVREAWGPYRDKCYDWRFRKWRIGFEGEIHDGWFLEQRSPETMALLLIGDSLMRDVSRDPRFSMPAGEAKDALRIALQTDCFRANGVDQETQQRVEITPLTWYQLKCFEQNGRDELRPAALDLSGPNRYRDVLLPSAALRGLWRAPFVRQPLALPSTIPPEGDGYIQLTAAAQWIATAGGSVDFAADDVATWRPAFDTLLRAIGAGKVRVVGTRDGGRERIEAHHFVDCPVELPFEEGDFASVLGDEVVLKTYTFDSEDEWRDGFSDSLMKRGEAIWSRIVVASDDIRALWPFDGGDRPRSGAPGKPSSMSIVLAELERRAAAGDLESSLGRQSEVLAAWLLEAHPNYPRATAKTIKNNVGSRFRHLRGAT